MKNGIVFFWLLLVALPSHAGQSVLGRDGIQSVLLSPDGEHIAVLNRTGDVDHLLIVSVTKKNTAFSRKLTTPQRVQSVAWVDDENLALQLGEDVKYELDPQPTGEIEILEISGTSMRIGGASNGETAVQRSLQGKRLIVHDGLSSIVGTFVAADQVDRTLWRINLTSDSLEPLDHPPFRLTVLSVSPDAKYMAAEGIDDTGVMRVMVWSDLDDSGWRELDGNAKFIAVSDSGIAFAIMDIDSGVAGLVSVDIETGTTTAIFQHESSPVDQVMVDSSNRPIAARYVHGFPSWFYLDHSQRLTRLHKSFRTAKPYADFSFVSSSIGGETIIARQTDDDFPSSFFVVDTVSGRADRLVDSNSALSIIGGDEDDDYKLQPIEFESRTGAKISGYISLPEEGLDEAKPTVVMLRGVSDESRWQWGFDEDTWFFHRQGFNVLMLNSNPASKADYSSGAAALMAGVSDVEDAIRWSVQEDLVDETRLCLYGRGSGADLALMTALRSDIFDCVISLGGTFENPDSVAGIAQENTLENRRLHALLVYGADDSSVHSAARDFMRKSLAAFDVAFETMQVEGERRAFSSRQNEVRVFARISSFLRDHVERKDTWPTLPLTHEQALAMDEVHKAFVDRLDDGVLSPEQWRQWFKAHDKHARNSLFDEQQSLYELYRREMIEMVGGNVDWAYEGYQPIRTRSIGRSALRQGSDL